MVRPMAESYQLDPGLPRHQGTAFKDGIGRLDQPGIRADALNILGDREHQTILMKAIEIKPTVIAMLGRDTTLIFLGIVAANKRGVNHEIGIAQGSLAIEGLLEAKVCA